jgi:hypothetical protein
MHRAHLHGFGVQGDQTRTRSDPLASNSICGWALGKEETGRSGEEFDLPVGNDGCYLPMQKLEKILPSRSSELKAPVISPNDC